MNRIDFVQTTEAAEESADWLNDRKLPGFMRNRVRVADRSF